MTESANARSVFSRQSRAVAAARAPGMNSGVSAIAAGENGSSSGDRPSGGGHGASVFLPFDGFVVQTNDGEIADGVSPREGALLSRGALVMGSPCHSPRAC